MSLPDMPNLDPRKISSIVEDELDFTAYVKTYGTYQYTQVVPQEGSTPLSLTPTSGLASTFIIPPNVFNFGQSYLNFTVDIPAAAGISSWAYEEGTPFFSAIQLYTLGGFYLVDLHEADKYMDMVMRRETKLEDMLTWDKPGTTGAGFFEGLAAINDVSADNIRPDGTSGFTSYLEPRYVQSSLVNTDNILNVRLNLSKLYNTLLHIDRDLWMKGESLYLKFIWNNATKISFNATSATVPTTGLTAPTLPVAIKNLLLYLAIEQNQEICMMLQKQVSESHGLQVLTPMVYHTKIPLTTGTNHDIIVRYNIGNGAKLKKIYWAPYVQTDSLNANFDHNNLAAVKLDSFYTSINGVRTSQFNYQQSTGDDYFVKKNSLRGSCIFSSNEYYYNFVWVEDFSGNNPKFQQSEVPEDNCIDGLSLSKELIYTIYAFKAANLPALNHYVFAVTQKLLTIKSDGIYLS